MGQLSPPDLHGFRANELNSALPSTLAPDEIDPSITEPHASIDEIFDIVSNCRRRYVVYFLKNTRQPTELGTLATQIAAWETDQSMVEVTRAERKRVYTSLQQVHLPKMNDAGLIRFEKPSSIIEPTSLLATIELEPTPAEEDSRPWHQYYLSALFGSTIVVSTSVAGVWPARLLSTRVWFLTTIGILFILAGVHTYANADFDLTGLLNGSEINDHE
jgi:hypothetical protein